MLLHGHRRVILFHVCFPQQKSYNELKHDSMWPLCNVQTLDYATWACLCHHGGVLAAGITKTIQTHMVAHIALLPSSQLCVQQITTTCPPEAHWPYVYRLYNVSWKNKYCLWSLCLGDLGTLGFKSTRLIFNNSQRIKAWYKKSRMISFTTNTKRNWLINHYPVL